jgi:hypothetical protein
MGDVPAKNAASGLKIPVDMKNAPSSSLPMEPMPKEQMKVPDSAVDVMTELPTPNRVRDSSKEDEAVEAGQNVKPKQSLDGETKAEESEALADTGLNVEASQDSVTRAKESAMQETCSKPPVWMKLSRHFCIFLIKALAIGALTGIYQSMTEEAMIPSGFALDVEACAGEVEGVTVVSKEGLAHLLCDTQDNDASRSTVGDPPHAQVEAISSNWWLLGSAFPLAVALVRLL